MTILVPLLVLRNSKLPLKNPLNCLCNCNRLVVEFSTIVGGLLDLPDDSCCCSPSDFWVVSSTTGPGHNHRVARIALPLDTTDTILPPNVHFGS
jgi:hypothetical protein